jgi:hypothetical protein
MCRLGKKIGRALGLLALGAALGCGGAAASVTDGGAPAEAGSIPATVPDAAADAAARDASRDASNDRPGGGHANKLVFVLAMENAEENIYADTAGFPYLTSLLDQGAHANAFVDILPAGLPSEPHYILMEAATNVFADHTFTTDSNPSAANSTASTDHLATQLGAARLSWTSYQEGIDATSGACPVASVGDYRPRHNPFVFFQDVAGMPPAKDAPVCAAHHQPLSALPGDLAAGSASDYVFITPNLCHDAHGQADCQPSDTPDKWVKSVVPGILDYIKAHDGVLFIVWDEAHSGSVLPFMALGPHVKPGYASNVTVDHRSLVKTVEEILDLPTLPAAAPANDLADMFVDGEFP